MLKFGKPISQNTRLEIRNDSFELLGSCDSMDFTQIAALMAIPKLPLHIQEQVRLLQYGKVIPISV